MADDIHLRLKPADKLRIELIRGVYDVSQAAVLRMGLVNLCRELGLEKGFPKKRDDD